jgi:hypothetical protein
MLPLRKPGCLLREGGDVDKMQRFCLHRRREMVGVALARLSFGHCGLLYNTR